jgi:hypothetical protein
MSLIKLAFKDSKELDSEYIDNRWLGRRARGKLLTYPLAAFGMLPAPLLGHYLDHRRKEKDFMNHPEKFKKK